MATRAMRRQATLNRRKAMAHPLRSEVLAILSERQASPAEMARQLGESVGNVSYHVNKLVAWDCAELVGERPVRGAIEHFYRATSRPLVDTDEWEQLRPEVARHLAGEIMQKQLDDFVQSIEAELLAADSNFHLTRTRLLLDHEGRQEAIDVHERTRNELLEVQARSAERMARSGEAGIQVSSSQGCFEVPART
jgi:DNA-binding transcriptional ArsR family regulator